MNGKGTALGKNIWATIILFGFIGQIAWAVENMYFNLFLFNYIGGTTQDIANMVMWSAIIAAVATIIMGALSDKLNKRKIFICVGYIIWGIVTLCFAFISRENVSAVFKNASVVTVTTIAVGAVIVLDCVMTFFGSTANDAALSSWITDVTDSTNRGRVEGVLATFPLIALLVVAGAFGIIIQLIGYPMFFIVLGGLVVICGIAGFFFVKDSRSGIASDENYFKSLIYGFRPSVIKKNKNFFISMIGLMFFVTATQVFMPYFIIYLEKFLKFDVMTYSIVMGIVILVASVMSVLLGRIVDKVGRTKFIFLAVVVYAVGLIAISFARTPLAVVLIGSVMMTGFVLLNIVLYTATRDYTPTDKVGLFQGVRIVFAVLIPMIIGPNLGIWAINTFGNNLTHVNEFGEIVQIPVPSIFVLAGIVAVLILIPCFLLYKAEKNKTSKIVEKDEVA